MALTGKRHPFYATFEVGFDDDGRLLAAQASSSSPTAAGRSTSRESICDRALFHLDNAYYVPAVRRSRGRVAKTNVTSHTAFRGFGGPQGMLVIEEILDRIARRLGLPPEVVRERNLYRGTGETNTTHYGQEIGDNRIPAIWTQLLARVGLRRAPRARSRRGIAAHPHVKRGLAITPVKFGISLHATSLNQAGALVLDLSRRHACR